MRFARRLMLAFGIAAASASGHAQQAEAPNSTPTNATASTVVRTTLKPDTGGVIGQRLHLFIDVLFRDEMQRPPRVVIPDIPAAQVMRFETQATNMSDSVDGKTYVGQRFEFAIFPRRAGELVIPPAIVTLLDKAGDEIGAVRGTIVRTQISVPPGVDASKPVVATRKMTLAEHWTPDPKTAFKAGDALVRTIARTADDVPGLAMRDLIFAAPRGVRVYVEPPKSTDKVERDGSVRGQRSDRVTYVFETAGAFDLPAVSQPWWNLDENRLERTEGGGDAVTVSATPVSTRVKGWLADPAMWRKPSSWIVLASLVAAIAAIVRLIAHGSTLLRAAWAARRSRWMMSEAKAFRDLVSACRAADAPAIYRLFAIWRARLSSEAAAAVLPLAADLERALYGGETVSWSAAQGHALAETLRKIRPTLRGNQPSPRVAALPPLNPIAGHIPARH
jgi:hypothetical protein